MQKDNIIRGFQLMNLDILGNELDANSKYQNVSKETFLKNLDFQIFQNFKTENDTELIPYIGKCGSCNCINKAKKGYSFVGNVSGIKTNFIIEGDSEVTDIFYCSEFISENIEIQNLWKIALNLEPDEENSVILSREIIEITANCSNAYEELLKYGKNGINTEIYREWKNKFQDLYNSVNKITIENGEIEKFKSLLISLYEAFSNRKLNDNAKIAVDEFNLINSSDENQILKWLMKYEDFNKKARWLSGISKDEKKSFIKIGDEDTKTIGYFPNYNYYINPYEFGSIGIFTNIYIKLYFPLLIKYQDPKPDFEEKYDVDEDGNPTYSDDLSFWIERKGLII